MIEIVYKGRDNPNVIIVKEDGEPIDFTSTSRIVMSFEGTTVVADTWVDPNLVDWSQGDGILEFHLNDLPIESDDRLSVLLIAYDPLHPDGQVLAHPYSRVLQFRFIDA